jgi:hypothetical protein
MANIALFIDGTANAGAPDNPKNTNVYELYELVSAPQKAHYIAGIGTGTQVSTGYLATLRHYSVRALELAFGQGATERIKKAYKYLATNYEAGDQLYLFGFSRGAFIARTLAGFIGEVGLLFASDATEEYIDIAFYLYWKDVKSPRFNRLVRDMRQRNRADNRIPTHFLGQWDTVETLTVMGAGSPKERALREIARREQYNRLTFWIKNARHALALHDLRAPYNPLLWSGCDSSQSLQQVWFAGAHADVGGGYDPYDAPGTHFSDIALEWMKDEACQCGLRFNATDRFVGQSSVALSPHDTIVKLFRPFSATVRAPLRDIGDRKVESEFLHDSVINRLWKRTREDYVSHDLQIEKAWEEIDGAAMQLHFAHYYPELEPLPLMSPMDLQDDFRKLSDALSGKGQIDDEELARILRLLTIFHDDDRLLDLLPIYGQAWEERLSAAGKRVLEELVEFSDAPGERRRGHLTARLEYFLLSATIPPDRMRKTRRDLKI